MHQSLVDRQVGRRQLHVLQPHRDREPGENLAATGLRFNLADADLQVAFAVFAVADEVASNVTATAAAVAGCFSAAASPTQAPAPLTTPAGVAALATAQALARQTTASITIRWLVTSSTITNIIF